MFYQINSQPKIYLALFVRQLFSCSALASSDLVYFSAANIAAAHFVVGMSRPSSLALEMGNQ